MSLDSRSADAEDRRSVLPVTAAGLDREAVLRNPAKAFGVALEELYRTAGSPPYATVIRQAERQRPPVKISASSLSDWLRGHSVPSDVAVVRFLIEYLHQRIPSGAGYPRRSLDAWMTLHQQARRGASRRPVERSASPDHRPGSPIGAWSPFTLEVHRVVSDAQYGDGLPPLTPYVPRVHDSELRRVVEDAQNGASRMVILVGGSSTGKTRACWEAVQNLDPRWVLWHPIDPSRPAAAAHGIGKVGPYTVIWLNETRHYLRSPEPALSEQLAAGLRTLLADPARAPVLVLGTLWPQDWVTLTTRPAPGTPDLYAQARDLLTVGTAIPVPDTFTSSELEAARIMNDPRLVQAAAHAGEGRVAQYLAAAPELLDRYRMAPPSARAIMNAAIDLRRLGSPSAIPHTFLELAAPGYLTDVEWDEAGDDWFEQGIAYAGAPIHGIPGPLSRIRPRPGAASSQQMYRLADYLDVYGHAERADIPPPASFVAALDAMVTEEGEQPEIVRATAFDRLKATRRATIDNNAMAALVFSKAVRATSNVTRGDDSTTGEIALDRQATPPGGGG